MNFRDQVVVTAADVDDLVVGDRGEVVGLSDDGLYVGVWIERLQLVYVVAVDHLELP